MAIKAFILKSSLKKKRQGRTFYKYHTHNHKTDPVVSNSDWNKTFICSIYRDFLWMSQNTACLYLSKAINTSLYPSPTTSILPASSTLKGSIPFMTLWTTRDAFTLALTLTDELKNNLYFFSETQGLNFNSFRILIWTFI